MGKKSKCRFAGYHDYCRILDGVVCEPGRKCSFFKTEEQYIAELDAAIELNRKKGNCAKCQYRNKKNRCRKSTE